MKDGKIRDRYRFNFIVFMLDINFGGKRVELSYKNSVQRLELLDIVILERLIAISNVGTFKSEDQYLIPQSNLSLQCRGSSRDFVTDDVRLSGRFYGIKCCVWQF